MELTDKELDILESYWNKTLSKEAYDKIEYRLTHDGDFAQQATAYFLAISALKSAKNVQKNAYLHQIDANMPPIPPLPFWQKRSSVVTAALVGITLMGWFFLPPAKPKQSAIMATYFKPFPNTTTTMSSEAMGKKTQEAIDTYNKQDFSKAATLYAQVFETSKDSTHLFYQAVSLLGSEQFQAAQTVFEQIQYSNILPAETAQWYLALIYTETQQKEKALSLLQKFANTEGVGETRVKRKKEALELIQLLDNKK
jgi:tetratricopeptide (TPR) repeat protein